jgi:translation initiation factor 1
MELSYSTDPNWCSKCKHLPCQCSRKSPPPSRGSGFVKMRREMRRGKPVIVLFETGLSEVQLKELLKAIQKACGAGGSLKDGCLEIQGDHRDKIELLLSQRGLKSKRAGG